MDVGENNIGGYGETVHSRDFTRFDWFINLLRPEIYVWLQILHTTNERFYLEADDTPLELLTEPPVSDLAVPISP